MKKPSLHSNISILTKTCFMEGNDATSSLIYIYITCYVKKTALFC